MNKRTVSCEECGFSLFAFLCRTVNKKTVCFWCMREAMVATTWTGAGLASNNWLPKPPIIPCRHKATPFHLTKTETVYASEIGEAHKPTPVQITAGLYMADKWIPTGTLLMNGGGNGDGKLAWLRWPDGMAIPAADLDCAVKLILSWLKTDEIVEIGCFGGHGRTGTMLAALFVALNPTQSAQSAIEAVRTEYCKKAIETATQEQSILDFRAYRTLGSNAFKRGDKNDDRL